MTQRNHLPTCPSTACRTTPSANRPASCLAVVRHSLLRTRHGTKHRWRCKACGQTFTANRGTAYHRLRSSPARFDRAVQLVMEGTTQASIARSEGLSPSTVRRWLDRASRAAHDFSQRAVKNVEPVEIQIDELRSYAGHRDNRQFVFAAIDVSARLWLASTVGKRTRRSCRFVLRQARNRCKAAGQRVLIVTDPFKFYAPEVQLTWGRTCLHVESGKIIRSNRIVRVNNELVWGTEEQLEKVRSRCEDSKSINTAFIERLNLTMRKALSGLQRKTNSAAKTRETLAARIDILQVYYNFVRPPPVAEVRDQAADAGAAGGLGHTGAEPPRRVPVVPAHGEVAVAAGWAHPEGVVKERAVSGQQHLTALPPLVREMSSGAGTLHG